jgi:signal transduction histidine kinase
MLLRKLADHYHSACVAQLIEGIIHNLNGPLQILYIRSEQLEQNVQQISMAGGSEDLAEVKNLADRLDGKVKSISKSLDELNSQLIRLRNDLIIERHSETGEVKINRIMEECLLILNANMVFKHDIRKSVELDDDIPVLKGRKRDFRVIILSLVQNALEAMADSEDKHLTVETSTREGRVIIKVQDTGCGIPDQDRERIFDPLFTTKKGAGYEGKLGLGLPLVSVLLEDYDGTIACKSVEGKTSFSVEIPCAAH